MVLNKVLMVLKVLMLHKVLKVVMVPKVLMVLMALKVLIYTSSLVCNVFKFKRYYGSKVF